jgi:hypothetical protein
MFSNEEGCIARSATLGNNGLGEGFADIISDYPAPQSSECSVNRHFRNSFVILGAIVLCLPCEQQFGLLADHATGGNLLAHSDRQAAALVGAAVAKPYAKRRATTRHERWGGLQILPRPKVQFG